MCPLSPSLSLSLLSLSLTPSPPLPSFFPAGHGDRGMPGLAPAPPCRPSRRYGAQQGERRKVDHRPPHPSTTTGSLDPNKIQRPPARQKAAALHNAKTVHPHVSGTGSEEYRLGRAGPDSEGRGIRRPRTHEGTSRKPLSPGTGTRARTPAPTNPPGSTNARRVQLSEWRAVAPRGGRRRRQNVRDARSLVIWGLPKSTAPAAFAQRLALEGVAGMAALVQAEGRGESRHISLELASGLQRDRVLAKVNAACQSLDQALGQSNLGTLTQGRHTGKARLIGR